MQLILGQHTGEELEYMHGPMQDDDPADRSPGHAWQYWRYNNHSGCVMKKTLCFAATTPFAVNAFLRTHLLALAERYNLVLCVNTHSYALSEEISRRIHVVHVDFAREIAPLRDLRALWQLLRVVRRVHLDAIHSITPKAGLLAMLAGFLAHVPLRCHTFTGQVWATKKGAGRWLLKQFDRLIAGLATHVFADSASQCRLLEVEAVVPAGGIKVLGDGSIAGVDLQRFRPDESLRAAMRRQQAVAGDAIVFLFVGRLVRDKGVFDLLAAFAQAAVTHPDWTLWMVGPDEQGLLAELKSAGQQSGCNIRWCGATPVPEQYMMAADVFVLPSYREGFGSVIIEAAACGIPTVAYRIDGVVDAVVDGCTGRLVEKGNIDALSETMRALGENKSERQRSGALALERAQKQFSATVVTREWQNFYASALGVQAAGQGTAAG